MAHNSIFIQQDAGKKTLQAKKVDFDTDSDDDLLWTAKSSKVLANHLFDLPEWLAGKRF